MSSDIWNTSVRNPDFYEWVSDDMAVKSKVDESAEIVKYKKKIEELSCMIKNMKVEYDRKELILKNQIKYSLPKINYDLIKRGMFAVNWNGRTAYLVRGVYKPVTIDDKMLSSLKAKKLTKNIYFFFLVDAGNKIWELSTRNVEDLDYFEHYHQARPDCWGRWHPPNHFKNLEDLFSIARSAELILENINSHSIARSSPTGFPPIGMLKRSIRRNKERKIIKNETWQLY